MNATWTETTPAEQIIEDSPGPGNVSMGWPCVVRFRGTWRVGFYNSEGAFVLLRACGSLPEALADCNRRRENAGSAGDWSDDWASVNF